MTENKLGGMEYTQTTTTVIFGGLLGLLILGTVTSPMALATTVGVILGLSLFGILILLLGIKHGEYRSQTTQNGEIE